MIRRVVSLVFVIFLVSAVSVRAEEAKVNKHATGRSRAKNVRYSPPESNTPAESAESAEIDDLSKNIRQALATLQKDIEKILGGVETASINECAARAKKQIIELLSVQGPDKKQSIATLSEQIKALARQVEDLSVLYRQKDNEFKTLSAKLNELEIRKKSLGEFRSVVKSFKNVEANNVALDLSANNDDLKLLNKRIEDVLSDASVSSNTEKKPALIAKNSNSPNIVKEVPQWISDKIKGKGKGMETAYGAIVVAKDSDATIISIKKDSDAKFRSVYGKFIRESYEAVDGTEYFVLGK